MHEVFLRKIASWHGATLLRTSYKNESGPQAIKCKLATMGTVFYDITVELSDVPMIATLPEWVKASRTMEERSGLPGRVVTPLLSLREYMLHSSRSPLPYAASSDCAESFVRCNRVRKPASLPSARNGSIHAIVSTNNSYCKSRPNRILMRDVPGSLTASTNSTVWLLKPSLARSRSLKMGSVNVTPENPCQEMRSSR